MCRNSDTVSTGLSTATVDKNLLELTQVSCRLRRADWRGLLNAHFGGSVVKFRQALDRVATGKCLEADDENGLKAVARLCMATG